MCRQMEECGSMTRKKKNRMHLDYFKSSDVNSKQHIEIKSNSNFKDFLTRVKTIEKQFESPLLMMHPKY